MAKIIPRDREAPFDVGELFYSRTDKRGVISVGNDVFYRVSGYPAAAMIGRPHNLVRHPDMPKAVFKYFWETVQKNQPIVAYIKNMAADGSDDWVLAAAFPLEHEYVSIRVKPTSPVRDTAEQLYKELLQIETKDGDGHGREGLERSYARLFERLRELGFSTYEDFACHALTQELEARDRALAAEAKGPHAGQGRTAVGNAAGDHELRHVIDSLAALCAMVIARYQRVFRDVNEVRRVNAILRTETKNVLGRYQHVRRSAFNMAIEAARSGAEGEVMNTVSTVFQQWAADVNDAILKLDRAIDGMDGRVRHMTLSVMTLRFQLDMLTFLSADPRRIAVADGSPAGELSADAVRQGLSPFLHMAHEVLRSVRRDVEQASSLINGLSAPLATLREALDALTIIRHTSRMEAAALGEGGARFGVHIEGLASFIRVVEAALLKIRDGAFALHRDVEGTRETIGAIDAAIGRACTAIGAEPPAPGKLAATS